MGSTEKDRKCHEREEKKKGKGIQGRRQLLQTPHWSMGSILTRKVGTKPGCTLKHFALAAASSDWLYMTYKDDFNFISSFLLQTFSSNFLWWTFEIIWDTVVEKHMRSLQWNSERYNAIDKWRQELICKVYVHPLSYFPLGYHISTKYPSKTGTVGLSPCAEHSSLVSMTPFPSATST